jgi:hypothetical protein
MTGYNIEVRVPVKDQVLNFVVERSETISSIKAKVATKT